MASLRFSRRSGFRKTKPVYVVAMEGARTEPIYFCALKPGRDAAVRLILVGDGGHRSNPTAVLGRLRDWAHKNGLKKSDEAWVVIDRDAFPEAELDAVCAGAQKFGYHVAVSNPCFELWLWLHLRNHRPFVDRHQCQRELAVALPDYAKGDYDAASLIETGAANAIQRALALDVTPAEPWPKHQATRVFRLVQKLLPHLG
jgi:hypothetical protein